MDSVYMDFYGASAGSINATHQLGPVFNIQYGKLHPDSFWLDGK